MMKCDIDGAARNIKAAISGPRQDECRFMLDEFARNLKEQEAEVKELQAAERKWRRLAVALLTIQPNGHVVLDGEIFQDGVDLQIYNRRTGDGKLNFWVEGSAHDLLEKAATRSTP